MDVPGLCPASASCVYSMHTRAREVRHAALPQAVSEQWCAGQVWIHTRFRRHCTSLPYRHWCSLTCSGLVCMIISCRECQDAAPALIALHPIWSWHRLARSAVLGKENGQLGLLLQVSLGPHSRPAMTWRGCMTLQSGRTTLRRPTMASTTTSTLTSTGEILLHHLMLCSPTLCSCCRPGGQYPWHTSLHAPATSIYHC